MQNRADADERGAAQAKQRRRCQGQRAHDAGALSAAGDEQGEVPAIDSVSAASIPTINGLAMASG